MSTVVIVLSILQSFGGPAHVPERPSRRFVPPQPPNIVVIVADDLGVDLVRGYGESPNAPCTTHIDLLANQGLLFRDFWANPVCSPARAALMTGRYPIRTGMGKALAPGEPGLPLSETLLPEILTAYESACIGKWHLSGNLGELHPNQSGFDHFAGFLEAEVDSYFSWPKTVDGVTTTSNTYTTIDITNEAIVSMSAMREPWFLYVSYNAPHTPLHVPPPELCDDDLCEDRYCSELSETSNEMEIGRAMVEALDSEIGRLLTALDGVDPGAYVFLLADNGTSRRITMAPFLPSHAKGTVYEGGVNVPLIVRGPGVPVGESSALVSIADLYATIAELGGASSVAEDSVSFVPCFQDRDVSPRVQVYTELFIPDGDGPPYAEHMRTARDERYKLIRVNGFPDEFYDLSDDPFEASNLLPNLSGPEQDAFDALEAVFTSLGTN